MLLSFAVLCSSLPAQQADYTFHVQTELVLVNVTVRDKNGNSVRGLKPSDFTIFEDGKPQKVVSFDVEDVDAVATQDVAQAKALTSPLSQPANPAAAAPRPRARQIRLRIAASSFCSSTSRPWNPTRSIAR